MATKKNGSKGRPVIVTTAHRGVFFGYTTAEGCPESLELVDGRMIVYYSAETRGVVGLAQRGPAKGSRVTPKVEKMGLRAVTAIFDATPKAAKACEAEPWA